jgi:hypothetical protein
MNTVSFFKWLLLIGVLVSLTWGVYYLFGIRPVSHTGVSETANWKTYVSPHYGFSFQYPPTYFLEEKDLGNGERERYTVILTLDTEENRLVREGKSPGREGPVGVTIEMYQNNLDHATTELWIRNTVSSNFKLGPGVLTPSQVGGKSALTYHWSGLYEGDTTATALSNYVYAFSVTYLTPEDDIKKDFAKILDTVQFR